MDVDYAGIYVTPRHETIEKYEIVMADRMRFKNTQTNAITHSNLTLYREDDRLVVVLHGDFQERPITMTTRHVRANIYINLRHRKKISEFLRRVFESKERAIPSGPDPTKYVVGRTWIPMKNKPSTVILIEHAEITAPRWVIIGEKRRAFLDIERDDEYDRVQMHLGIRFGTRDLARYIETQVRCEEIRPVKGLIEITGEYIDLLYSYLKKYGTP